jgi:CrcB protein
MIRQVLLVGLGGGLGSIARFLCQRWAAYIYPNAFPWGTMAVNVLGSLLIGVFWGMSFKSFASNENWKLFLMTGICGGFTTFSAFSLESINLLRENRSMLFFVYIACSVIICLLATYAGMKISRA